MTRCLRVLALVLLAVWLVVPQLALAQGADVVLAPDPGDPTRTTGDFDSIQAALDAVAEGATITLMPGRYQVNLFFPRKAITLQGDPNADQEQVILDGSGCDPDEDGSQWCSVVVFDWDQVGGEQDPGETAVVGRASRMPDPALHVLAA